MSRLRIGLLISTRLMLLVTLCGTVAGCAWIKTLSTGTTALPLPEGESTLPFCMVAKPITYSAKKDSPETVQQIREHNALGPALGCKSWQ